MKKLSKFQQLAAVYRTMPNGGARLKLFKNPAGTWIISDGMCVKGSFLTHAQAVHSLELGGFREIEPDTFKLEGVAA